MGGHLLGHGRGYGNGLSEEGYGRFFARNPEARKEIFLVTKLQTKGGNLTERLDKSLKRLQTDHVDLFFIHSLTGIDEMTPAFKDWAAEMKKAGKIKFFGFSTHTNMEDCLLGAAKLDWIDAVMLTYNFRVMHSPKMQEAVNACAKAGVGLVAMKTQGGGPGTHKAASKSELKVVEGFLKRGFTDKQAKLKVMWENPQIASLCSQMPSLTILSSNVAAARDQTKLAKEEFESLRQYALETKADYCAGCGNICQAAVGGAVPVNEVMRCLMYHRDYGEPELARQTFAGLPEEVRQRLTEVDYSQAEQACPQGLAIAALMRQAQEMLAYNDEKTDNVKQISQRPRLSPAASEAGIRRLAPLIYAPINFNPTRSQGFVTPKIRPALTRRRPANQPASLDSLSAPRGQDYLPFGALSPG